MKRNYLKLRGRIKSFYGTESAFAKEIGMSPSVLSSRLNGITDFKKHEMIMCNTLLELDNDYNTYFFE